MRLLIISASPKGKYSITYQSVRYMQKHFPQAEYHTYHVGQKIKAIERNEELFDSIMQAAQESDCILWVYPVYTFLVPYQLVKFIDMIFERGREDAFKGKYTSQISTSKHFYDHTAYNYIHRICEDLQMKHLPGHCADMDDLTHKDGRKRLLSFATELFDATSNTSPVSIKYTPTQHQMRRYVPPQDLPAAPKAQDHQIVLVTDCSEPDSNLGRMIDTYRRALPHQLQVINIGEFDFQGGCLGCFHCAFDGNCVYHDGFDDFHRNHILNADCIIIAATIKRHWFNPIWKCYDDRQFYNGHRTSMMGKAIGYIIAGPLRQEANLREILEARAEVSRMYLLDMVTDEYESDEEIASLLTNMADKTMWAMRNKPQRPQSFLGVGGMKVFRDLIYVMRGLMQEDHRFYKQHGLYKDLPQRQVKRIAQMTLIGLLLKASKNRNKAGQAMNEGMLKQYDQIIERY